MNKVSLFLDGTAGRVLKFVDEKRIFSYSVINKLVSL